VIVEMLNIRARKKKSDAVKLRGPQMPDEVAE